MTQIVVFYVMPMVLLLNKFVYGQALCLPFAGGLSHPKPDKSLVSKFRLSQVPSELISARDNSTTNDNDCAFYMSYKWMIMALLFALSFVISRQTNKGTLEIEQLLEPTK